MFITLTIDTNKKRKKKNVQFASKRLNKTQAWRKQAHIRKRSLWQKVAMWRKSLKQRPMKLRTSVLSY